MAPAMMKVPASMRSGMMRCFAPSSCSRPSREWWACRRLRCALPFCSEGGEVGDFRLARAVLQDGLAFGECRGHQQVFGASDSDFVEDNFGAFQSVGAGLNVAVFLRDLCAEFFETFEVEVDGARTDSTAAGKRDAGVTSAGHQRAEYQRGGAHGFHQFIRSFGGGEVAAVDGGAMLGASIAEFDFGAHGGQQVACGLDVAHLWNIFENDGFFGKQGCGHAGQGSVFRAADADRAEQRLSAADDEFVHEPMSPEL